MPSTFVISALLINGITPSPFTQQSSESVSCQPSCAAFYLIIHRDFQSSLFPRAHKHKTKIFTTEKVDFGNVEVGKTIQAAMGPACGHGSADCQDPWSRLTQKTQVYIDDKSTPVAGTLTFSNDADFDPGMSADYVNALAAAGAAAAKHHT